MEIFLLIMMLYCHLLCPYFLPNILVLSSLQLLPPPQILSSVAPRLLLPSSSLNHVSDILLSPNVRNCVHILPLFNQSYFTGWSSKVFHLVKLPKLIPFITRHYARNSSNKESVLPPSTPTFRRWLLKRIPPKSFLPNSTNSYTQFSSNFWLTNTVSWSHVTPPPFFWIFTNVQSIRYTRYTLFSIQTGAPPRPLARIGPCWSTAHNCHPTKFYSHSRRTFPSVLYSLHYCRLKNSQRN